MISIRIPAKQGSDNYLEVCCSIGHLCIKWEHLESRMLALFSSLKTGNLILDSEEYADAFSFQKRKGMVLEAAKVSLDDHPEILGRLDKLMARTNKLAQRRNQVIHGQLETVKLTKSKLSRSGGYIGASIYVNGIKNMMMYGYHYSVEDIYSFADSFEKCRGDLNTICDEICDLRGMQRI